MSELLPAVFGSSVFHYQMMYSKIEVEWIKINSDGVTSIDSFHSIAEWNPHHDGAEKEFRTFLNSNHQPAATYTLKHAQADRNVLLLTPLSEEQIESSSSKPNDRNDQSMQQWMPLGRINASPW